MVCEGPYYVIRYHAVPGDQTCTERNRKLSFAEQFITRRALSVPDRKLLPHSVSVAKKAFDDRTRGVKRGGAL